MAAGPPTVFGHPTEQLADLYSSCPSRHYQVTQLLALFGQNNHLSCPRVFLYGPTGSGKSHVISSILNTLKLPHALVNCVECYTSRLLYDHILNQVALVTPAPDNDYTNYSRCDNMNDFVKTLRTVIEDRELQEETMYIVLDKAERLREMDMNILPAFLRLGELTGCNVCVVLLTEIVWEKFRAGTGMCEPLVLHFPDYTKDELLEILSSDCPTGYTKDFYMSYINIVLSVFYMACRNLNEIRHLALLNFPKFCEPIKKGEATEEDVHKLWRNIEPHLRKALQTVYLREVSSAQWERMQEEAATQESSSANIKTLTGKVNMELPFYSKFLLIAAYLASYNPARTDRRFFLKHAGKMKKTVQQMKRDERASSQLLGPKPFPLDRLMAIFYSIVEGKVAPTANIYSQISSLVTLRLMTQVGSDDQLDGAKFKCTVGLDFMRSIARTVNFDIIRYLYDFV
uniref:Uncharacterized protein n=1 Tax=Branchiostoma floridae TaxID=7739 RepID=C3Z2M7_BRAFL|eukprot:XP_002597266.1 hypothetical protein BRAFLDRAFT_260887 [Branchiostoma floridae]